MTVTRKHFIEKFMRECGVTYAEACRIYESMVGVFEDGVVNGHKIRVGRVGAISPVRRSSRVVSMNFKRGKEGSKQFYLGSRYTFKFTLYKQFIATHSLRWFGEIQ